MAQTTLQRILPHIYSLLIGGGVFLITFGALGMGALGSSILGGVGYLISIFLIFPDRGERSQTANRDSSPEKRGWAQRHLALLVFLGTLFGSLLGALGSLSEIVNGLFVPTWKSIFPSPQIRIVGSNTILGSRLGLSDEWREDFQTLNAWQEEIPLIGEIDREFRIEVDPIGSLAGIREAQHQDSDVHVLATSEPIPDESVGALQQQGVTFQCAAEIGYDVIVFVTDKNNPVPILSKDVIGKILTGEIRDWSQLGEARDARKQLPIIVFARQGSGTTDVVLNAFTGSHSFPSHFVECRSNAECLNQAVGTPGSLYWVSLSWLYTQPPDYMQVILVQAQENAPPTNPYEEGFNPIWYPSALMRPLFLYVLNDGDTSSETLDVATQFFYYVRGVRGQKILEQHNFYTHFSPPSDMHLPLPPGFGRQHDGTRVICR
jgi:ABC-type phosphate transport system substrate-binding protein